jgi:hypothetical protein
MIETSRRHGAHDPRFGKSRRRSHLHLVPVPDDGVNDDGIDAWEDEGGQPAAPRPTVQLAALSWDGFSREFFPGRRRHDFEPAKAYEAYRATGALPATEPDPGPRVEAVAVAVSLPR